MTEHALAVREAAAIVQHCFDDPTKELIRKTVSDARSPLTTDEFDLFIAVCAHSGLNPLRREIYCAKIDGKFTIMTGIDGHRRIAQASPRFRGMAGPFYCGADGQWTDVWLQATPPVACKVGVYLPGRQEPTWGIAYYKNYKNRRTPTWQAMPEHMLAVRAESFALRKCFSRELGGVALPPDDEGWDADQDAALDAAPPALEARRVMQPEDFFRDEDVPGADLEDPTEQQADAAIDEHEREQAPEADPLEAKRASAREAAAACRAAGIKTADPHPQATEVALDEYLARHRRLVNARPAR